MTTASYEDRAVSPVIGLILMVAITVILAAVIGNFVLNLGNDVETNIQAGANIDHKPGKDTIDVTWTGNKNAKKVTVKFKDDSNTSGAVDYAPTLNSVGDATSYTCDSDGATVRVIVVAQAGGVTSVIQDKTFENC